MAYSLPIGVRFRPTKEHLVAYFLATRLKEGGLPAWYPQFIDYDVYTDHPFNIMTSTMERRGATDVNEGFFFSRLNKVSPNGTRINRCIKGHGTWLEKAGTNNVSIGNNVVGTEKYFMFKPKDGSNNNGNDDEWRMHEYHLHGNDDKVLCRITRKPDSTNDDDEGCRGLKRSQTTTTTCAKMMPLDYDEAGTSKRGRIEYDEPAAAAAAGCSTSGIIQDYVSSQEVVMPLQQGNDNSALETTNNKDALTEEIEVMMLDDCDKDDNTDNNSQQVYVDPQVEQLLEAAEKIPLQPNGAQEDDDGQFDIGEFVQGLLTLPDRAQDNIQEFDQFYLDISSLPPLPAFLV